MSPRPNYAISRLADAGCYPGNRPKDRLGVSGRRDPNDY